MADTKISALTAAGSALLADEFAINESGTSKKLSADQIKTLFQTAGIWRVFSMASDHTIATIFATEVTQLGTITLEPGTYVFEYFLIMQSAATATGLNFPLNFTGTVTEKAFLLRYPSTGGPNAVGVADDVGTVGGQMHESNPQRVFSTGGTGMAFTGVDTVDSNILGIIEGVMVVTASGDLELWHASEAGVSTSVKAGSSLMVMRVA